MRRLKIMPAIYHVQFSGTLAQRLMTLARKLGLAARSVIHWPLARWHVGFRMCRC
jgi:hypothetical protein